MTQPGERVMLPGNRPAFVVCIDGGSYLRDGRGQPVECDMGEWWTDITGRADWQAAARERTLFNHVEHTMRRAQYTPEQLRQQADAVYPPGCRPGD